MEKGTSRESIQNKLIRKSLKDLKEKIKHSFIMYEIIIFVLLDLNYALKIHKKPKNTKISPKFKKEFFFKGFT